MDREYGMRPDYLLVRHYLSRDFLEPAALYSDLPLYFLQILQTFPRRIPYHARPRHKCRGQRRQQKPHDFGIH
jgi:hypothetical protein